MPQDKREEDAEQGWSEYAALFHVALDFKRFGQTSLELDSGLHVAVERPHHADKDRWAAYLGEGFE